MRTFTNITATAIVLMLVGCASPAQQKLTAGYKALENHQPDQALAAADEVLAANPKGRGAAEALYLRGRAYEERVLNKPVSIEESRRGLQAARSAYVQALGAAPAPTLEAYIRSSLANVAYFQDDYETALGQWAAAYDKLDKSESRSFALYRMGLSQQRLGRFDAADRTFAQVRQLYPNSDAARRAAEHQGVRTFWVQIGAFANAQGADSATAAIRREGLTPARFVDSTGKQLVRVGPASTYAQARALRARLTAKWPDAMIVP